MQSFRKTKINNFMETRRKGSIKVMAGHNELENRYRVKK